MIIFGMSWAKPYRLNDQEGTLLLLYVQPGASKTSVKGIHGDRLKISIQAPPVDGAANEALVIWLSKTLGISKSKTILLSGDTARHKNLWVSVSLSQALDRLGSF